MRARLDRWRWWLATKCRIWAERLEAKTPAYQTAFALSMSWRHNLTVSGEYKRHQVYAAMVKQYPDMRKRDISLMIERAVHALP
jgi:hypothetical protein